MINYTKQPSENMTKIHSLLISKKLLVISKSKNVRTQARIRISPLLTIEYIYVLPYVLVIHVKIPEKRIRPKNCRNRNPAIITIIIGIIIIIAQSSFSIMST